MSSEQKRQQQKEALARRIAQTIRKTCAADAECVAIPFGVKSCGGPRAYLVVSNPSEITPPVEAFNLLDAQQLGPSNCSVPDKPPSNCQSGYCRGGEILRPTEGECVGDNQLAPCVLPCPVTLCDQPCQSEGDSCSSSIGDGATCTQGKWQCFVHGPLGPDFCPLCLDP